jgi:hypothetical protein
MALSTAANARQRLVLQQKLYAAENSLGACRFHVRLTDEGLPRMPEGGREGRSAEKKGAVEAERKELAALVAPHEAAFAQARKTLSDCDKRGAALEEEVLQCPAARAAGSEALRALSGLTHQARMDALVLTAQTDVDVRVIKAAVDTAEELFYLPDRKRMLSRLTSVGNGKYLGVFMTKVAATA